MERTDSFTTWLRVVISAALAITLGTFIGGSAQAVDITPPAGYPGGGLQAPPFRTAFEIDGNKPSTAPGIDWDDLLTFTPTATGGSFTVKPTLPGPYTTTTGGGFVGVTSTGIIEAAGGTDPDVNAAVLCGGGADGSAFPGSTTIDDYPWDDNTGVANTNNKSDICTGAVAWELVRVTTGTPGQPGYYDQNHAMLYQYWTRSFDATGEVTIFQSFDDGIAGNCGDFLVAFDYNSNVNDVADYRTYRWEDDDNDANCTGSGEWVIANPNVTGGEGAAGRNPDVVPAGQTANQGTFGESAIDLTSAGLLPQDECRTFTTGDFVIKTGQSDTAQLIDVIGMPPIEISNCGSVEIKKESDPPGLTTDEIFTYDVAQADLQPVHDDSLTGTSAPESNTTDDRIIEDVIGVGDTHLWSNVLAQPDYTTQEANPDEPAPGWQLDTIVCTYYDAFDPVNPGVQKTATTYTGGAATTETFMIFPPQLGYPTPSCVITNSTSGVLIEKTGAGTLTTFDFTVNGEPYTVDLGGTSELIPFAPGTSVTIVELAEAASPAWTFGGVTCDDTAGTSSQNPTVGITTEAGEVITCTFTNNQAGQIIVEKIGAPAGGSFDFEADIDGNVDDTPDFSLVIPSTNGAGAYDSGNIPAGTYTITELLAAANAGDGPAINGSVSCTNETPVGPTTGDVVATVDLAAGEVVTCTFSNNQLGRIIVEKVTTNGDGTFGFDLPGDAGDGSITTVDGTGTSTLSVDVMPGTHDVTETIPAGWNLDSVTCSDGSGTPTIDEDSGGITGIDVAAGEIVTCTFTNTRETAKLTLTKDWSADAEAGDSVTLTATGDDSETAGPANGSSTAPSTDTDAVLIVYPGETVSLAEAYGINTANYTATLSCDNAAAGTLTYTGGALSGSFAVVDDDPQDVTCTFVNSRDAANLTLQKVWIDGFEGDADRGLGPDTAVIDADGSQNTSTVGETDPASVTVPVLSGATVDLSETLDGNTGTYTTELTCTDAAGLEYTSGDLDGTYTMPAEAADVTCTFTNTRTSTGLTLTKTWTNAADGDSVDLTIIGEAGTGEGANSGDGTTADDATLTVYSGEVVDLSEAFNPGDADWYNTGLTCTAGDLTYTADELTAELEVRTTADPITCTFTNDRRTANVVVAKDIAPDADGGLFDLSVNGDIELADAGDGDATGLIPVFVGDPVSVSEANGTDTDLANYTSTLACDNGVVPNPNTGTAGGFDVPDTLADGATITCTFTNTRKSAELTLTKDWVNGATGDAVSLTASGDSGILLDALGSSTAPDTDADAVLTVWAGEAVTLTEVYVPDNTGSYTADLSCTDANGLTYTDLALTGTYAVPSTPVDVTCTFVNTRTSAELTLQKAWVDGADGDIADLDIGAQLGQIPADGNTSTSAGVIGTETDDTNVVTATVLSGETVSLGEVLGAGNTGAYDSTLACGQAEATDGTIGTYTMPKDPAAVTCTFTNTRTRVDLVVDKAWVDAVADDTTEITVTGDLGAPSNTSTATGADGTETDTAVVTATVLSGEVVDVAEVLGAGNDAAYTSSLDCGAGVIGTTDGEITVAKDATADITCTFTNAAQRGTIIINKNIDGVADGTFDFTGNWTIDGVTTEGAFQISTDGLTGMVTFNDVLVPKDGSPYTVVETGSGSSYDATSVTCVDTDGGSGPAASTDESSTLPLTGLIELDNGETVSCDFTNTEKAKIVVVKDADPDSDASFDFTGPAAAFGDEFGAFSLVDDGTNTANEEESALLDARDGETYVITEEDTPGWNLTSATCLGADDFQLNGSDLTVDVAPGVTAICTFVNEAQPAGLSATKSVEGVEGAWGPFTFTLAGGSPDATFTNPAEQQVGSGLDPDPVASWENLVEGETYTITEDQEPGYETGATFDCTLVDPNDPDNLDDLVDLSVDAGFQFEAVAGGIFSCSITNVAIPPTLVVEKTTVGGTGVFTFDVTPTDLDFPVGPLTADTTVTNPASTATVDLQAGVGYTVAEQLSDAWVEGPLTCTVTPAGGTETPYTFGTITQPGDEISCEITNTRRAQIVTEKTTVPAEAAGDFGFEASWNGAADGEADFTLADGGSNNSGFLDPGVAYTVTEIAAPGFALTDVQCDSDTGTGSVATSTATITPAPGEIVTCEFTNSQRGPVTIAKDAVTDITRDGTTYSVTYEITVSSESYIDELFDLTDSPDMAPNVTVTSMVVNGPGVTDHDIVADGELIVDDGTIPARAGQADGPDALVYTVVTTFTMTPSNSSQECVDGQGGNGAYNSATVTFEQPPTTNSDDACVDLPTPDISVEKVADGALATQVAGFQYQAVYTVTVTNDGEGPGSYTIADLPAFPDGATVDDVTLSPEPDPVSNVLEAGGEDVYTVTVLFTVDGELDLELRTCGTEPTPGQGGYNGVTVTYGPTPDPTSEACVNIPDPNIGVTKVRTSDTATLVGGTVYSATYTVTVSNTGSGPGAYSVLDVPVVAGDGVISTTIVPEPAAITAIEAGGSDVYTVTVLFDVPGDLTTDERTCVETRDEAGSGAYNGVTVTWNGEQTSTDEDCVDIPNPNVEHDKVVVGDGAVYNGDNNWTVTYDVTVTNLDPDANDGVPVGPSQYTLTDSFDFGPGATVNSVTVTPNPDTLTVNGAFDGDGDTTLATDVLIEADGTHTYTITVDVDVVPTEGTNGDCTTDGGFRNAAGITVASDGETGDRADQEACAPFSVLTLVKVVVNDDGGEATADQFTLTATLDSTEILSGDTVVTESVPAGDYVLAETQLAGYTTDGFTCGEATMNGQTVTVADGASVTCTIVNDDEPVDLEITKNDDGVTAIAGGAPFDYTITVQNVGTRDADLGEPVTVVDELPLPLQWVSFPDNCVQAGQTLTCDIDPALMTAGGDPVVITATVSAPADAASGTYVNEASVTTEDDPVCEPIGDCEPPPCEEAASNNNIDCEPTPVDREGAIQIVKTDNVAAGDSVLPGEQYNYTLRVTNTGVSTILPGLVVTDDLPAQLSLVSVSGGTGWTCNNADPIECTYAPSLAPGASAPNITVVVSVNADATGTEIDNTAVVQGAVDRECPEPTSGADLSEAFVPACNQVTDDDDETTPLTAQADLAIDKTASVATVGAGGGFNWVLVVENLGPAPAIDVVVGDLVPSAVTVTGVTSSFFDCSRSGNDVTCTRPEMAVGASGTITIAVTVPTNAEGGNVDNLGRVEASTPDPNLDNNSDDATVVVVAQIPPTSVAPTIPATGSNSTEPVVKTAMVLLMLGALGLVAARRRRPDGVTPTA